MRQTGIWLCLFVYLELPRRSFSMALKPNIHVKKGYARSNFLMKTSSIDRLDPDG
jgi:hypothetical protein